MRSGHPGSYPGSFCAGSRGCVLKEGESKAAGVLKEGAGVLKEGESKAAGTALGHAQRWANQMPDHQAAAGKDLHQAAAGKDLGRKASALRHGWQRCGGGKRSRDSESSPTTLGENSTKVYKTHPQPVEILLLLLSSLSVVHRSRLGAPVVAKFIIRCSTFEHG